MKIGKRLLSIVLCLVLVLGLMPTTALAANFVDFLTTSNAVEFVETGEGGFYRVNLFGNGKVTNLPDVYRTDTLNYAFAGWYTEKEGGVEVDESTVFDGYTILYDRWEESNIEQSKKISGTISIPIANPVNGQTALQWYNASSLNISVDGVEDLSSYAFYHGLNASGAQLTDAEVIDTDEDYSAVTVLRLENGYYFDYGISLTAANGVRAGTVYQGNGGISSNYWNSEARQILVTINFPAGANTNGFTTEPVGGTVNAGQPFNFTWAVSGDPTKAELQMKNGNVWAKADDLTVNNPNGTIAAQTGTKTYRILVTYGNSGSIYCNEFTVTWLADVVNSFSMSPASGTVKNGTDYDFTWACVRTPATATIERKTGADWTSPEDLGTATSRTITYKDTYANSIQTFRIKATMTTGDPFYSDEFTVTYDNIPMFTVQPVSGKAAIGNTYLVKYTVDIGNLEFSWGDSILQKKNGESWEDVSTEDVYLTETEVPAKNVEATETYRVGLHIDRQKLYSEPFAVQWVDDYTFELDQNSLNWGTIAKADFDNSSVNELEKYVKVMPTGTKAGTFECDPPTNFEMYEPWQHPIFGYTLLTFYPKSGLAVGTYSETVNVWVEGHENDKVPVTLALTVEEDTPQQPTEISTINITGIPTPTADGIPDVEGIATDTAGISLDKIQWEKDGIVMIAANGDTFEAGTTYMLYVEYSVDNGYEKAQEVAVTTPNFTPDNNGVEVNSNWIGIKYTVPAPQPTMYNVSYNANGGIGAMNGDTVAENSTFTLDACGFTAPDGQRFKAWAIGNPNGEQKQPNDQITITGDTTIYAIWENIPQQSTTYTVTVTNGSGSGDYTEGANVTITANAPENGKQFKEWTGADNLTFTSGSKTTATATFTMPAEAVTVTATYEDIPQQPTATLTDIAITNQPTKTQYTAGESFVPTGMEVTAYYSDQSSRPLGSNEYTYAPTDALTENDTLITVSYTENGITKTANVQIIVNASTGGNTGGDTGNGNGNGDGGNTGGDTGNGNGNGDGGNNGGNTGNGNGNGDGGNTGGDTGNGNTGTGGNTGDNNNGNTGGDTPNPNRPVRPTYPIISIPASDKDDDGEQVTAPDTFDGGTALYVGLTILSATGGAWLAKKKED